MKRYLISLFQAAFPAEYSAAWFLFNHPSLRYQLVR